MIYGCLQPRELWFIDLIVPVCVCVCVYAVLLTPHLQHCSETKVACNVCDLDGQLQNLNVCISLLTQ